MRADAFDLAQPLERREVLDHVTATLGVHDGRSAVEDVITGEQRPFLVEQEAQMIRQACPACESLRA